MRLTRRQLRGMISEAMDPERAALAAASDKRTHDEMAKLAAEHDAVGIIVDVNDMEATGGGYYPAYITANISESDLARVWRAAIQSGAFTESVLRSIADSQHATGPIFKISDDVGDLAYELLDSWTEGAPHPLRGIVWIYHEDQDAEPDPSKKWGAREPNTLTKV